MIHEVRSVNRYFFRLSLAQLVDLIEEDDIVNSNVYILPPENGNETEADSDESDDEHVGDINHLPRGILNQLCEFVPVVEDEEYEPEDLIPLSELRKSLSNQKKTYKL